MARDQGIFLQIPDAWFRECHTPDATHMCYFGAMPSSITSSFRISAELERRLSRAAERTGKGKNAILVAALTDHLDALERIRLAVEARRQSEVVSRHEQDESWYEMGDATAWK